MRVCKTSWNLFANRNNGTSSYNERLFRFLPSLSFPLSFFFLYFSPSCSSFCVSVLETKRPHQHSDHTQFLFHFLLPAEKYAIIIFILIQFSLVAISTISSYIYDASNLVSMFMCVINFFIISFEIIVNRKTAVWSNVARPRIFLLWFGPEWRRTHCQQQRRNIDVFQNTSSYWNTLLHRYIVTWFGNIYLNIKVSCMVFHNIIK